MAECKFIDDLPTTSQNAASVAAPDVNELFTSRKHSHLIPDDCEQPDGEGFDKLSSTLKISGLPWELRHQEAEIFLHKLGQIFVRVVTQGLNGTHRLGSGNILTQPPTITEQAGRRNGVIYVKTACNMVQSTHEEQNCKIIFFNKSVRVALLRPKQILRSGAPEDLLVTLVCEVEHTGLVDLILETYDSLKKMAEALPSYTKEVLLNKFCITVQSEGTNIVVRAEKFQHAHYGIRNVFVNGRQETSIRKIEQNEDALTAGQAIRKALLYQSTSCQGSCGSPVVKLIQTQAGISLDVWTHVGVDRTQDLGITSFKVLEFKELPIPLSQFPAPPLNEIGHYSEVVSRRVAHPAMRDFPQRLLTLKTVASLPCSAMELATGGFFFIANGNGLSCFECGYIQMISSIPPSPFVLHYSYQPSCQAAFQYLLLCCVCHERRISSLVFPCQHLKLCGFCSANRRRCPECNMAITNRIVYQTEDLL